MLIELYGASFRNEVIKFDALIRHGVISPEDLDLFQSIGSLDEAFDFIIGELNKAVGGEPCGRISQTC